MLCWFGEFFDKKNICFTIFFSTNETVLHIAGQDMVPEQAFQVQKDHEAWLKWTWRRTPSSSICLRSPVFTRHATPVGRFHAQQRYSYSLWRIYELFRTLVPGSSSRPNGQNSDDVMGRLGPSTVFPRPIYWFQQFTPALFSTAYSAKHPPQYFLHKDLHCWHLGLFACRFLWCFFFFF